MKHLAMRCLGTLMLSLLGWGCIVPVAWAEQRLALVVGIDQYPKLGGNTQLQRAVADADSVGESLRRLGYQVTSLTHGPAVTQLYFLKQLRSFTETIRPGDMVVFYFAGHGIDIDGNNLLIPADIPSLDEIDGDGLQVRALSESTIRHLIDERRPGVALLLLDACRDNPFKSPDRSIGATRGLQPIEAPKGMMTIYAASAGQTALDRLPANDPDPNSLFTRVVVRELGQPGINIVEFSEDIRDQVEALARSVGRDQVPAVESNLFKGRSIFLGGAPPAGPSSAEEIAWSMVEGTTDAGTLRRFVDQFPQSRRTADALARLASLEPPAPAAARPAPDDEAWASLPTSPSPVEIRAFMIRFPQSHLLPEAERRLAVARDDALWTDARNGDAAAQREYLFLYPEGAHRREAERRLAALEAAAPPSPPPEARPAPVADDGTQWPIVSASTTPEPLRRFIAHYPQSSLRPEAEARLRALDDELWKRTRAGGVAAQRLYLASFADGTHHIEAQARIAALEESVPRPAIRRPEPEAARRPAVHRHDEAPVLQDRRLAMERNRMPPSPVPHRPAKAVAIDRTANSRCFSSGDQTFCQ